MKVSIECVSNPLNIPIMLRPGRQCDNIETTGQIAKLALLLQESRCRAFDTALFFASYGGKCTSILRSIAVAHLDKYQMSRGVHHDQVYLSKPDRKVALNQP